jgi:hypothetical protein
MIHNTDYIDNDCRMDADSDGEVIETVFTCRGNLEDPEFQQNFDKFISNLGDLLCSSKFYQKLSNCYFHFFLLFIFQLRTVFSK